MKNQTSSFVLAVFAAIVITCLQNFAVGQTAIQSTERVANVRAEGMAVRFESGIPYSNATLTVSGPDGSVSRHEFQGGTVPSLALFDKNGAGLGNGQYTYELRFTTVQMSDFKERLSAAKAEGVMDENGRLSRRRLSVQSVVQSGSFAVQNCTLYVGNEVEPTSRPTLPTKTLDKNPQQRAPGIRSSNTINRLRNHRLSLGAMPDFVIADDLIVQGSACVGLDCVNGEVFGFDTIRTKENNTRIQFTDTSTAAGFPTNNWQIRANSSVSGGANFLAFVDQGADGNSETGTILFEVDAGAPANSLKVSSTGKVGLRTATPVLDLHMNTGDTPAARFEQNSSGGFTAQTWDVAGNEANFFVRDVTGGSRLPFRIRPGAPTSSIDINASGQVGIGTASPGATLDVTGSVAAGIASARFKNSNAANTQVIIDSTASQNTSLRYGDGGAAVWYLGNAASNDRFRLLNSDANGNAEVFAILQSGNVGIGTTTPDLKLSVSGDADKSVGGGSWQVFSDERLKNINGRFNSGLKAVMQLQPIRYQYKPDNALGLKPGREQVGFGAQSLQKVIPEAVTKNANGYLMVNNDPILWTMLNAIKEQQKEIVDLKAQILNLRTTASRRQARRSHR